MSSLRRSQSSYCRDNLLSLSFWSESDCSIFTMLRAVAATSSDDGAQFAARQASWCASAATCAFVRAAASMASFCRQSVQTNGAGMLACLVPKTVRMSSLQNETSVTIELIDPNFLSCGKSCCCFCVCFHFSRNP